MGDGKDQPGPDAGGGEDPRSGDRPGNPTSTAPVTKDLEITEVLEIAEAGLRLPPPPSAASLLIEPGVAVGRYELVELLGSGGMGSVYRAHDPHLSRDIALKVLHPPRAGERVSQGYRQRLLREAQVLAKLSHPNVVAAFDVGSFEDVVFVAMELIQGESLRGWLSERRTTNEVLAVMIAAGRGLVAAHTAGVLHRDFKPVNVMVSPDGRVRVVDFGLARSALSGVEPGVVEAAARPPESTPFSLESELTQPGVLMGTPGYIAPEQLHGEPPDTLADQYSYAVTVFVALSRQKPPSSASATSREPLVWPREVPQRVRRVVERGLAFRPAARYPSVEAMVEALERALAPRRRSGVLVAIGVLTVSLTVGAALLNARSSQTICQVSAASFEQVWEPERRAALRSALVATGRANAEEAFGLFAGRLDTFEAEWLAMKRESCEATHVRGEQSEKVLALRSACLDRKLAGVSALVTAFSRATPAVVDRVAGAMPDTLDECADTAALLGTSERLPADPAARSRIARLEGQFPVARALAVAGEWKEARESARSLLDEARSIGHDSTTAQALRLAAFVIYSSAKSREERQQGEAYLREAIPLAARAGDDRLVARSSSYLFELLAYGQDRIQEAEAMLPHVDALVIRAGDLPEDRIELLFGQAEILSEHHKYPEAIELFDRVSALSQTMANERRAYGSTAQAEIGEIFLHLERYPEAVERMRGAVVELESVFGGHHPRMLIALGNLALAQSKVDADAARATLIRMRALAATLPSEDWRAIVIPFLEGQIREDAGDCVGALPFYRDALTRFTQTYGAGGSQTADVLARLGACLLATGQQRDAVTQLERALTLRRENGAAPSMIAEASFALARALGTSARPSDRARAIESARQARQLYLKDDVADKLRDVDRWLTEHDGTPAAPPPPRSSG